jgi:hypothetical protein
LLEDNDRNEELAGAGKGGKQKTGEMGDMLKMFNSKLSNKVADLTDTSKNFYYLKVVLGQTVGREHNMVRAAVMHGANLE